MILRATRRIVPFSISVSEYDADCLGRVLLDDVCRTAAVPSGDQLCQSPDMIQPRSVMMFMSGVGFTLAVVLSCNGHGHVTTDANVADASLPDTSAPDACCSSITVSGITRTVSAENDASRLRSAVVSVFSGSFGPLVSGPFVLTDIAQHVGIGVTLELYLSTGSCVDDVNERQVFLSVTNSMTEQKGLSGRFWIPGGTSLCFHTTVGSGSTGFLLYSGFVPY